MIIVVPCLLTIVGFTCCLFIQRRRDQAKIISELEELEMIRKRIKVHDEPAPMSLNSLTPKRLDSVVNTESNII